MPQPAPYGTWTSPITAADVAAHDGRPGWVGFVGEEVWWTQPTPDQGGRVRILRRTADGSTAEVLPPGFSARNRVFEYGGRPWAAVLREDGPVCVFTEWSDQRIHRISAVGSPSPSEPVPITAEPKHDAGLRYSDLQINAARDEIWCVREEFHGAGPTDLTRAIVAVALDGSGARVLTQSHHFLANPRLSADGRHLAWLGWNHPAMPWDETELCVAEIRADGTLGDHRVMAGGSEVSVAQAEWLADDRLVYVSDLNGWWNPYTLQLDGTRGAWVIARDEEFAGPLWQQGQQWIAPLGQGVFAAIHGRAANTLSLVDTSARTETPPIDAYTEWAPTLAVGGGRVAAVAASTTRPYDVVTVEIATGEIEVVHRGVAAVDPAYLPEAAFRTFTGRDGREIHANLYPPHNPDSVPEPGELPPYLVIVHGGPTSRAMMIHDLEIAYFTSRGIGVVEVNYGGSTGHGRVYRNRLRENWGVVDVRECADVARALVAEGLADPARLGIRGGSAGGWTTAASLSSGEGVFAGGAIRYPILDLAGLRTGETHDFESQYLDSLIGPWPAAEKRYRERSPINQIDAITAPFLLMQGLEDEICPPVQCERFLERVKDRGVWYSYLTFEGEQHGFRRDSTIIAALEAEMEFYGRIFGFSA
jgi:dipeptidyl aminopeptidase/acylaminoacyl peptidase